MSLTYDIPPSGDHVRVVGSGALTADHIVAMIRLISADTRWTPYASALVDLRAATFEHEDEAEIINVAAALEQFRLTLKGNIAIVAGPAISFFAEIFAVHVRQSTAIPIRVFAELPAAEEFCRERPPSRPTVGLHP